MYTRRMVYFGYKIVNYLHNHYFDNDDDDNDDDDAWRYLPIKNG